ncbi:MAG: hypothetical protein IKK21_04180, partial [Clostridia bacterium]|nr:hypothetical protein [Clostridia bacterium]
TECYLYWSCMETETCPQLKKVWTQLFTMEISHLHEAAMLLEKEEGKTWQQVLGTGEFPAPLVLESNVSHVRDVLKDTVQLTACRESYAPVEKLEHGVDFFRYQDIVNRDVNSVASHAVIDQRIRLYGSDYRFQQDEHPLTVLRDRTCDNIAVGRIPGAAHMMPPPAGSAPRPSART